MMMTLILQQYAKRRPLEETRNTGVTHNTCIHVFALLHHYCTTQLAFVSIDDINLYNKYKSCSVINQLLQQTPSRDGWQCCSQAQDHPIYLFV